MLLSRDRQHWNGEYDIQYYIFCQLKEKIRVFLCAQVNHLQNLVLIEMHRQLGESQNWASHKEKER